MQKFLQKDVILLWTENCNNENSQKLAV